MDDRIGVNENKVHIGTISVKTILVFTYALLFCLARTKMLGDSVSSLLLLLALIIVCIARTQYAFSCMLFSLFISDGLMFFSIVSFQALIDLIVTLKLIASVKLSRRSLIIIGIMALLQIISIFTFDNSYMNVISFLVRIVMLFCIIDSNDLICSEVADVGCISVVAGSIIGLLFYQVEYWQRFSAVWNDENFCGMYCLLGIAFALTMIFRTNKRRIIFPSFALVILFITATKTWSRSFIFITCLVLAMALLFFMKQRSIKPIWKVIIITLSIIGFYLVLTYSFGIIIAKRGLFSTDGSDWSNGRMQVMLDTFRVFADDFKALLFGCGAENVPNLRVFYGLSAAVTHNTYVDLFIQFGFIEGLLITLFIFITYVKGVRFLSKTSAAFWMLTIPLIYMATLSITQYTFFYVAMGLFIHNLVAEVDIG